MLPYRGSKSLKRSTRFMIKHNDSRLGPAPSKTSSQGKISRNQTAKVFKNARKKSGLRGAKLYAMVHTGHSKGRFRHDPQESTIKKGYW